MKKNSNTQKNPVAGKKLQKLLPLLWVGCIALSGCGNTGQNDSTPKNNVAVQEVTPAEENTQAAALPSDTAAEENALANAPAGILWNGFVPFGNALTPAGTTQEEAASAAQTQPAADESPAQPVTGERHSVTGIITDASKYFVAFQTQDGKSHYLSIPETGLEGGLHYVTIGQFATLHYIGSLDENHAILTSVTDSSMTTDIYLEEYAFAIKIINAVKAMDMEALSDLSNFPLFIDTGNYNGPMNTPGEFEAIDSEKIFTEALLEGIANYNLFDLKYSESGFHMGNGGPNITFDVDDNGILGIIGITSVSPEDNTK